MVKAAARRRGETRRPATRLTNVRRDQLNAHATTAGIKPAALWASDVILEDRLADDGTIDVDKVAAAV